MSKIRERRQAKRSDAFWKNRTKTGADSFGGFEIVTLDSQPVKRTCLNHFRKELRSKKPLSGGLPELGKKR